MTSAAESTADVRSDPMSLRPFTVVTTARETYDTVTLEFVAADDGPPVTFLPGQFTMLYVFGVGEVPLSISGDPADPARLVHTVRAVGAVTDAICELQTGDRVGVRGPYGTSWPLEEAEGTDVVIVAGGIGLAPVRPAIRHILAHRDLFGTVSLAYGARSPADLLYADDVHEWKSRFDMNAQVTVDRGDDTWLGDVGVVTPLLDRMTFAGDRATAIVCGPEIMMRVVARSLEAHGVSGDDVSVSLERNMKCGIGQCGHCQFGPSFVCTDGPVFSYASVVRRLGTDEL